MKKVCCCVPLSWDYLPAQFFKSYCEMSQYAIGKYGMSITSNRSCYMDHMRDQLASIAIKEGANYILFLDADQTYPADTPERLMKHVDSGKLVVGGVTPDKRDGRPLVYKFGDRDKIRRLEPDEFKINQGLKSVDCMGFGGIMVHPKVFRKMKPPYFKMSWDEENRQLLGEDVKFYLNCRLYGIQPWCDTDLVYGHVSNRIMNVHEDYQ